MMEIDKVKELAKLIAPDTETEDVLTGVIRDAEALVLNRMYPFGYSENKGVPPRYERIQIQLAAELYTQRGAEGQSEHTENGVKRTWPSKSRLLAQIVPHCGSVMQDA